MSGPARLSALGVALLGVALAACAGIVGADFGDVRGGADDGGVSFDTGNVVNGDDAGQPPIVTPDSGPILVADGGACPTGYADCGGLCFDLASNQDHCSACDKKCPSDPHGMGVCSNSACSYACGGGYTLCDGGCCPVVVTPDAGKDSGPPADPGIPCANGATGYCSPLSGGFCCGAPQDSSNDECGDTSSQLSCSYYFFCGSTGECPATAPVCCYDDNSFNQDSLGKSSTCQTACANDTHHLQFCKPGSTECLTGTCTAANTFTGDNNELATTYYVCQ